MLRTCSRNQNPIKSAVEMSVLSAKGPRKGHTGRKNTARSAALFCGTRVSVE
jgi:hypothetical protein